jgi:flagellar biosynthesis GTPase FlhF
MSEVEFDSTSPEMNSKRFVGPTLREVFAKVRSEFGPDAMILEQRSGKGFVEVIASAEGAQSGGFSPATRLAFCDRLRRAGFEEAFVESVPEDLLGWEHLRSWLTGKVSFVAPTDPLQGSYRLLGAPGVGKTTTIIKLMAERVLTKGPAGTRLISTDTRRLAGCEQLAIAADLLGVEFVEIPSGELSDAVTELPSNGLVLIDTAGTQETWAGSAIGGVEDVVVLPAQWQASALQRQRAMYGKHTFKGAAITHIDQAVSYGACMSVIARWSMPVMWLCAGSELPDDLERANLSNLAALLLQGIDQQQKQTMFA